MSNPEFPHPDRPSGDEPWGGFFASIRRLGIVRTNERWIGGVAGGLARRLGIDPVLVRCIWIVVGIFSGIGLLLYGLAWALLPEEDGRIHVEQALVGDVSAGLAGGAFLTIAGLVTLDHGVVPSWYIGAWRGPGGTDLLGSMWSALWILLLLSLAYAVIRAVISTQRNRRARREATGPQPVYGQTGTPGYAQAGAPVAAQEGAPVSATGAVGADGGDATADGGRPGSVSPWGTGPTAPTGPAAGRPAEGHPTDHDPRMTTGPAPSAAAPVMTYPGTAPATARPRRPRVPGPGHTLSLIVLGAALLSGAGVALALATDRIEIFGATAIAAGIAVVLLGTGVLISGIRGRRGGWMTWIGWLAAIGAVPVLALTSLMPATAVDAGWDRTPVTISVTDQVLRQAAVDAAREGRAPDEPLDLGTYSAAAVTLDLTGLDAELAEDYRIGVTVGLGSIRIISREGLPLTVNGEVRAGSLSTETASGWDYSGAQSFGANDESPGTGSHWPSIDRYAVDGTPRSRQIVSANDSLATSATMRSPGAQEGATGIAVDAVVGGGVLEVVELTGEVTWEGILDDAYWIVESWTDTEGGYHADSELPVPGMRHPAISWSQATDCLNEVIDTTGEDEWAYGDPSSLGDLDARSRRLFEGCAARTIDEQGTSEASPAPTAPSGATPSPTPVDGASPAASGEPAATATATATATEAA